MKAASSHALLDPGRVLTDPLQRATDIICGWLRSNPPGRRSFWPGLVRVSCSTA